MGWSDSSGTSEASDGVRRIGRFTIEETLGRGGMGKVYLCRTPAGLRLAVKVIRKDLADDHDIRVRFNREVDALLGVRSPYTLPVYAAETVRPPLWLAARYVEGPTLDAHVRARGPLPGRRVAELGAMLAEALSDVHAHGVIHRDLKPTNIILEGGEPRLIDFGIARSAGVTRGLTIPGSPLGTHGYMPREQLQGDEPTPAVDVFALGAVLVFAATGHPPFGHGLPASLRIHQGEPPRLTGVPRPLVGVIAACLSAAPAERPAPEEIMAALRDGLREHSPAPAARDHGPGPGAGLEAGPGSGPDGPDSGRGHAGSPDGSSSRGGSSGRGSSDGGSSGGGSSGRTPAGSRRARTVPVPDPPHHCHVPVPPADGEGCALRPVAARLLASGLSRPLIRKAVLQHAR
ncbi:serine/threonine-protein kinase [Streptomyces sp. NPDC012769]|uniref:serine/threonine-protein kinase n=1 Tax=Streptomyces sp. NPDC012769 TaxID=3364848 RepID=UPI00369472CA